jgi:regulator of protease activity HflC (stomatin/prohibitin superfamily)
MNHGNNDYDSWVERMNRKLAKLMGKKDGMSPHNSIPSDSKFLFIVGLMLVVLWSLTGIYYIRDGSCGLLLVDGKIKQVVNGLKVGLTFPYPFAKVVIIDSSPINLSLDSKVESLAFISKDQRGLDLSATLTYSVKNPRAFFLKYYQEMADIDQQVKFLVAVSIQRYFLLYNSDYLLGSSFIVLATELRQNLNQGLSSYGLQIDKLNISALVPIIAVESGIGINASILQQISEEAKIYQEKKQQEIESLELEFHALLPQYQANPVAITQLIYYKMLAALPASAKESYPLLSLSKQQFIQLALQPDLVNTRADASSIPRARQSERTVEREREFN